MRKLKLREVTELEVGKFCILNHHIDSSKISVYVRSIRRV